ncbi:hypothetical protein PMG11_09665 [Penicillium brasilianum]|uniref:MACPF-like domain-containing protein n=1 Tax=Penicillium brasilianum TaxID=104259 RepID=A0A0F7TWS1_PENBI|nr:hypothetical protein PMG11_09665 [Penicillium brasilianum]
MTETSPFHIQLDSSDKVAFPSLKNTDLKSHKLSDITLAQIRENCHVSGKYDFSTDGKASIADSTTLEYYVSLTPGNRSQFQKESSSQPPSSADHDDEQTVINSAVAGIPIVTVKLIKDKASARPDKPDLDKAFKVVEDTLSGVKGLESQQVQQLSKSIGKRLAEQVQFTTDKPNTDVFSPASPTETDWQEILFNNKALHGWVYKKQKNAEGHVTSFILEKAPKRAFEIRRAVPGTLNKSSEKSPSPYYGAPGIPLFAIDDESGVTVTEIGDAFQHRLRASQLTPDFGTAVSIKASYEKERSTATTTQDSSQADELHISYNFPRVTVTIEPETIQLSRECRRDALNISNEEEKNDFFDKYGHVFASEIGLGGRLQHTRKTAQSEKGQIEVIKERMQVVAGASFTAPYVGASAVYGHSEGTQSTDEVSKLNRSLAMSWAAKGGDTTLFSNPPLWATTVKNFKYWRLLNQCLTVNMESFMRSIDSDVATNLRDLNKDTNIDPTKHLQEIGHALRTPGFNDPLVTKIKGYFEKEFNKEAKEEYNKLQKELGSKGPNAPIQNGKWGALTFAQRYGIRHFMIHKGLLFNVEAPSQ